ncbi:MAG: hypothetical protein NXH85_13325 [Pseudomonadaceae bacterium]|nr:hypothetical protein [Pseudomonadaceae bacterium]
MTTVPHNPYLLVGVDYELFFGRNHGSIEHCLIEPTDALIDILETHGMFLSLFVDAGYLLALSRHRGEKAQRDHATVARQLESLSKRGHEVQLHVHPHWQDSEFDGETWAINTQRYRLHDFSASEQVSLVAEYKTHLQSFSANEITTYRAGGWCMQPFDELAAALAAAEITVDSTVFAGGVSEDRQRGFDFSNAPIDALWRFDSDPLKPVQQGKFLEIPIGSIDVGPTFFWRSQIAQRLNKAEHASLGDGGALRADWQYYFNRLTQRSIAPASIDGSKAMLLPEIERQRARRGDQFLNLMGHPKALSRYSLSQLDAFLKQHKFQGVGFNAMAQQARQWLTEKAA